MKVTFVITSLGIGGAERVVSIIANYLCQRDVDVQIIAVYDHRVDYPVDDKIRYVYIPRRAKNVFTMMKRIADIRHQVRDSDIVISFLWHVNIYTIVATRFMKKRVIVADRSDPRNEIHRATHKVLRNVAYRFADYVVFQTYEQKSCYSRQIQERGLVIPNPIAPYLPKPHDGIRRKNIVSVCRLAPQKNIRMTIDAFSLFHRHHPDYTLTIYGEGELRDELESYVEAISLKDSVYFPGFVINVHDEIVDSAMYISSSDYEGISNSMLEALAMGLPCIVTDCPVGGARMFVKHYENGILVKPGDTHALYEGMRRIVEDPEFAEEISGNASVIRMQLSPDSVCRQWIELLYSGMPAGGVFID